MTELPLRDIHLPDPISWWPLAPGWWMACGVVCFLLFLAFVLMRRVLKPTLKKQALKEFSHIEKMFADTQDATQCLSELSVFLRRVALSQQHPLHVAGLTGKAWLEWLDQPLAAPEFSQGIGQLLLEGPYQCQAEKENVSQLLHLCRKWINYL